MFKANRGFSIPEMLAVIAIIVTIIAMLLPSLQAAREEGRMVVCLAKLSQTGRGTMAFATDHKARLPGIWASVWIGPKEWQECWMSNPKSGSYFDSARHTGVLWQYMNQSLDAYRCPSLDKGVLNSGIGSNGKFDYAAFHAFAGAYRYRTPTSSKLVPYDITIPTPWIVEEAPWQYLNAGHIEAGFGGGDKIGAWHNNTGNYVAVDASAHRLRNSTDLSSWDFEAITPSGATVRLGSHSSGWGGWNTR